MKLRISEMVDHCQIEISLFPNFYPSSYWYKSKLIVALETNVHAHKSLGISSFCRSCIIYLSFIQV